MKRIKHIVATLIGISALGAAFSASAVVSVPSGWYMEGNVGTTSLSNANFGSNTSSTTSGAGYNLNGGFKFLPYFGAELGITKYATTNIKANGVGVGKDTNWSYDLAGKGILPISDSGAELFAKLGVARLNSHVTTSDAAYLANNNISLNTGSRSVTGAYIGVGGGYNFMPNLAMVVQWQRAKGNSSTGNADLYSLGVNYIFG